MEIEEDESKKEKIPMSLIMSTPKMPVESWQFHKGDRDPYPTVPHGHSRENNNINLDVYQGYITKNGEVIDRASRHSIVILWNNSKFRDFAEEALKHFVSVAEFTLDDRYYLPLPRIRRIKP